MNKKYETKEFEKEAQLWQKVTEPKVEELLIRFNQNGKPSYISELIDINSLPEKIRKRMKNKK